MGEDDPTESDERGASPAPPRAVLVRRGVYALFVAFTAAFILSSTAQLVAQVFGFVAAPLAAAADPGAAPLAAGGCQAGIARLLPAIDRAAAAALPAPTEVDAVRAFRAALLPEWEPSAERDVAGRCAAAAHGDEAFAALLRLRAAAETTAARRTVTLEPLRRDVEAYLARAVPKPTPDRPLR